MRRWSLKLCTVSGIGIYVHWTFSLLVLFIAWMQVRYDGGLAEVFSGVVLILALFVCVVLHELGHALTGQRFGIQTRDIILLPIGGMARMERMPEEPTQELVIALAGPAVNVVIAALLLAVLIATGQLSPLRPDDAPGLLPPLQVGPVLTWLLLVNVILVVFNMIPAFPMDGGRVLRALLAYGMDYVQATRIAARTGQVFAVLFFIVGVIYSPFLAVIGVFIFLAGGAEAQAVAHRAGFRGKLVADAMLTHFHTLSDDDRLSRAIDELLAGSQTEFPVMNDGRMVGLLTAGDLRRSLPRLGADGSVSEAMQRACESVREDDPLDQAIEQMRQTNCQALPVVRDGRLVGLLTFENVGELLMVRSALRQHRAHHGGDRA